MAEGITTGISSILVVAIAILLFFFWISMLIDCARRSFSKKRYKTFWIFVIALTQVVGAAVYWFIFCKKNK